MSRQETPIGLQQSEWEWFNDWVGALLKADGDTWVNLSTFGTRYQAWYSYLALQRQKYGLPPICASIGSCSEVKQLIMRGANVADIKAAALLIYTPDTPTT